MQRWQTGRIMETTDLRDCPVAELEKILESYPWYSVARKELFLKMSAMGEEYRRDALRRNLLFLYPDYGIFREAYVLSSSSSGDEAEIPVEECVYELDLSSGTPEPAPEEDVVYEAQAGVEIMDDVPRRQIYVAGGDYFLPEDLKGVQGNDLSSLETVHGPAGTADGGCADGTEFTDAAFYTETLARIYAEQELYDRANEVYEKLILLYPEKNAYFAALIKDIKKHL